MTYLALYRAWRPQTFNDVIGQEHITQTLQNALREGRFSHAYLFTGPRGTGKTSTAKIFAKAVNCEHGLTGEPCNQCRVCKGITDGSVMDVVEIDAASNRGVEEIRDLREKVKFTPTETKYKVYIIDEVHMLTTEAFNALLKTLEEPPAHVIFILATTEPHKLPLTIISRCQRFDFRRITVDKMVNLLMEISQSEGFEADKTTLSLIARHSEGGMRDALSLLDQIFSFTGNQVKIEDVLKVIGTASYQAFAEMAQAIYENKTAHVLDMIHEWVQEGKDPERILEDLLYYYRDMLLYKTAPALEEIKEKVILYPDFPTVAQAYSDEQLYQVIETLNQYLNEMKRTNQTRILLELAIVKAARMMLNYQEKSHSFLQDEIEALKSKVKDLEVKLEKLSNQKIEFQDPVITEKNKKQNIKSNSISGKDQILQKLQGLSEQGSKEQYQNLLEIWPKVLHAVKQKKVTVHAWFIDGEPVAVADQTIIIAFNNQMHRDTTDKADHRQLIEEIINEHTQKQFRILNIMKKDWDYIVHQQNEAEDDQGEDEIVKKAIDWFGEDLVEIKD